MASKEKTQAVPRRARNSLSRELILDAAQDLAQSHVDISIRNVASILECSPMALYRYFPDKQDLLCGLLDRVIGSVELTDGKEPWDERLMSLAKAHLKTLQNNSWAIPLLFQNPDPGPAVRRFGEAMLATLKIGGARGEIAISTFSSILALNYGWAGFTAIGQSALKYQGLAQKLGEAPGSEAGLPETLELWPHFEKLGNDRHHEIAIRKLISNAN